MDEDNKNDAINEDVSGAAPTDSVTADIEKLQQERQEYLEGWKRALADYDNLKKANERDRADQVHYAVGDFVRTLLPVMDSWSKAEAHRPAPKDDGSHDAAACNQWMEGMSHVRKQFESALAKAGVMPINEVNVLFDPNLHEAMMMQPAPEGVAPHTVLQILEPGVKLHDRVLKPAKVTVAE